MKKIITAILISTALLAGLCTADDQKEMPAMDEHKEGMTGKDGLKQLMVHHAVFRTPIPGAVNSAAFFELKNAGKHDIIIVGAKSGVAKMTQIHNHINDQGVMKMRQVEKLTLAAGDELAFKPGGLHIMFMGLEPNISEGQMIDFQLLLASGKTIDISAMVGKVKKHKM